MVAGFFFMPRVLIFTDFLYRLSLDGTRFVIAFQVGKRAINERALLQLVPVHLEYLAEVAGVLQTLLELGEDMFHQGEEVLLLLLHEGKLAQ